MTTAMALAAACLATPALAQESANPATPNVAQPDPNAIPESYQGGEGVRVYDPWENTNRKLYAVHEDIDEAVLEPAARGYRAVTNQPVRRGVSNFLRNLRAPVVFVNDVLQGEPKRAGVTAARFGLNTTIGLFGILDPAESMGLERHDEDFGQTLAVWGVPDGAYVFVPALGPTTVRDGAGRIVDIALSPLSWAEFEGEGVFTATRITATALAGRESVLDAMDDVNATSLDPYVTIRTSYGLLRDSAISNGRRAPEAEGDAGLDNEPRAFEPNGVVGETGAVEDDADWGGSEWSTLDPNEGAEEEAPKADEGLVIGGLQQ